MLRERAEGLAVRHPELIYVTPDGIALTSWGMNVEHALVVELMEGVF
jgi:hypothetical protein